MALAAMAAFNAVVLVAAGAAEVKIGQRPLTPYERESYTNAFPSLQIAGGTPNVGIGQPLYIEVLVTKGTVVTQVNWTLVGKPTGSLAALQTNPLTNDTYDAGDRNDYDVAGRTLLAPDVACTYFNGDYKVRAQVLTTGMTFWVTNTVYGSTNIGANYYLCLLCHPGRTNAYNMTTHATAFERKINGSAGGAFESRCLSCHTLGYDTNAPAINAGFDDVAQQTGWSFPTNLAMTNMVSLPSGWNYATNLAATNFAATNWAAMPVALQSKANIQCENCHGPADRHKRGSGDTNAIGVSLSAGNCGQCHDSRSYREKIYEWTLSKHAFGYVFVATGSCAKCHSAKGFIELVDADYAGTNVTPRGTGNEGITCVACHDPHAVGMGENQLRSIASVTLSNGVVNALGGNGLLCMTCHRSPRNAESYVVSTTNNSSFGPHYAPQADMLIGTNAVQYGMAMPVSRHIQTLRDSCLECHMQATSTNPAAMNKVGGHTFSVRWNADTPGDESDDVLLTGTCTECHGEVAGFDFGGEDYDRDGSVEGVQSEIEGLLEALALLLPPVGSAAVTESVTPTSHTLSERKALYNYLFVMTDGSRGVHNAKYAAAILQASIDDLSGGIDVDRDGLLDSWELAEFGNLSGNDGDGDADDDGLSNGLEMAAGTNPELKDTDGDGFSDLVEFQAGSNPLDPGSELSTNYVVVLPAIELGYRPGTTGVTQQFQSIGALGNTGWSSIGSNFVSSNAWFYQLWSTRDAREQRFFRAVVAP